MKTIELKSGRGYKINSIEPIIIDYIKAEDLKEYAKNDNIELIVIDLKKIDLKTIN